MMPCPTRDQFVRFVDSSLSLEETRRVEAHVAMCPRCREQDRALRTALGDIKAATVQDFDVQAHIRAVMERVDRLERHRATTTENRARPGPFGRFIAAGSVAACGVVLLAYVGLRVPRTTETWQPRGGPVQATIGRDVGVQPYTARGNLRPLGAGATFDDTTPLTAGFRNLGEIPAFLLLFAVDARGGIHWISPRFTRSEDNPASTTLPPSLGERVLDTTVVLEDVSPGPVRIVAVITPAPAHVSDVESLEGTELSAARMARRLPGAEVRETMVEVRHADGAAP